MPFNEISDITGLNNLIKGYEHYFELHSPTESWSFNNDYPNAVITCLNEQQIVKMTVYANRTMIVSEGFKFRHLQRIEYGSDDKDGVTGNIKCVGNVSGLFQGSSFNQPIYHWDMSEATDLSYFFADSEYNMPLVVSLPPSLLHHNEAHIMGWNTSNVVNVEGMFQNSKYNHPLHVKIGQHSCWWNTSKVTNMNETFKGSVYDHPLIGWNTSSTVSMVGTFKKGLYNHPLCVASNGVVTEGWYVGNVVTMNSMFRGSKFNHPLLGWDVSKVKDTSYMFYGSPYEQPITNYKDNSMYSWDISSLEKADYMFNDYEQPLSIVFGEKGEILSWGLNFNSLPKIFYAMGLKSTPKGVTKLITKVKDKGKVVFVNEAGYIVDLPYNCSVMPDKFTIGWSLTNVFIGTSRRGEDKKVPIFLDVPVEEEDNFDDFAYFPNGDEWEEDTIYKRKNVGDDKYILINRHSHLNHVYSTKKCEYRPIQSYTFADIHNTSLVCEYLTSPYNFHGVWPIVHHIEALSDTEGYTQFNNPFVETSLKYPLKEYYTISAGSFLSNDVVSMVDHSGNVLNVEGFTLGEIVKNGNIYTIAVKEGQTLVIDENVDLGGIKYITGKVKCIGDVSCMFRNGAPINSIAHWDMSEVTKTIKMFENVENMEYSIEDWNVEKVEDMSHMFSYSTYNHPLGKWKTYSLRRADGMFEGCTFNYPIGGWYTSKLTSTKRMFKDSFFNQPINSWDTKNLEYTNEMFSFAIYNHPLGEWNMDRLAQATFMFNQSPFNHPINSWKLGEEVIVDNMFNGASFNHSLREWPVINYMSNNPNSTHYVGKYKSIPTKTIQVLTDEKPSSIPGYVHF